MALAGTVKNGWHEGEKMGNRNVPVGAKVLGSVVAMSGEIIDTLYYDPIKRAVYKVCDWKDSKPQMVM